MERDEIRWMGSRRSGDVDEEMEEQNEMKSTVVGGNHQGEKKKQVRGYESSYSGLARIII